MAEDWTDIAINLVGIVGILLLARGLSPERVRRRRLRTCLFWSLGGVVGGVLTLFLMDVTLDGGPFLHTPIHLLFGFMLVGGYIGAVAGLFMSIARWPERETRSEVDNHRDEVGGDVGEGS